MLKLMSVVMGIVAAAAIAQPSFAMNAPHGVSISSPSSSNIAMAKSHRQVHRYHRVQPKHHRVVKHRMHR